MQDKITRYFSCADTAKLVRQALKENFPGQKFSVRSHTYSGGASIDVYWTDGPTEAQVSPVVKAYQGATFDGMTDMKSYHYHEVDGVRIHYGADFIFTNRTNSPELIQQAIVKVHGEWAFTCPCPTLDDFQHGRTFHLYPQGGGHSLQTLVHMELAANSHQPPMKATSKAKTPKGTAASRSEAARKAAATRKARAAAKAMEADQAPITAPALPIVADGLGLVNNTMPALFSTICEKLEAEPQADQDQGPECIGCGCRSKQIKFYYYCDPDFGPTGNSHALCPDCQAELGDRYQIITIN